MGLGAAFAAWWREGWKRHGPWRTAWQLLGELLAFLRDSLPSRRRLRYGDMEFDWEHPVSTTAGSLGWRTRLLGVFSSPYQPTEPALFHQMLAALAIDVSAFTFIDLGSGKGRTLLMASDHPFRRILGVELLPELHAAALANIARYSSPRQQCRRIEAVCADASRFAFPPEPTVLYLFNPLPESGLQSAIANLERSLAEQPRPVYVVYHNPVLEHALARSPALRRIGGTHQYVLYAAHPIASAPPSG